MPSSIYAAWSVVAGEQPTTAKWNILGVNDSSFNTGNGFNDAVVLNRHMGLSKTVDANGWTVYNFGGYSVYSYSLSVSVTVTNGQRNGSGTIPLPAGYANSSGLRLVISWEGAYSGHATPGAETGGSGGWSTSLGNEYTGGALTFNGKINAVALQI